MISHIPSWMAAVLAFLLACAVAWGLTPLVKKLAVQVGAVDDPASSSRRIHDHPIPRLGGLAIFLGFILSALIFVPVDLKMLGMLIGAVIIAAMGAADDILDLNPWLKLALQILGAAVAIACGVRIEVISNPNFLSQQTFVNIGMLTYPLSLLWIVGCTNAVNLIDGLDGLAVGLSAISALTMLVVAVVVGEPATVVLLAGLIGACLGFIPYNFNPAKIFMGDSGSQFLGYILGTVSILGMFKLQAIITFLVPVLAMSVPLADTAFAFFRRIVHGQSPFHADRGHFHHRLLALGLSQKQAVGVLYSISAVLGLIAVMVSGARVATRVICMILVAVIMLCVWLFVLRRLPARHPAVPAAQPAEEPAEDSAPAQEQTGT